VVSPVTRPSLEGPQFRGRLGRRFALILLPLVLIPLIAMGLGAYFRSRALLQDQASSQMISAAQAQISVLNEWTDEREQRLQLGSQRSELTNATADLLNAPTYSTRYREALESARAQLEDLRTRQGQVLFSNLLIARSDGSILAATNTDWEGQTSTFLTKDPFPLTELHSYPIFDDAILAPGALTILSYAPLRTTSSEPATILIGVNSDVRLGALFEAMQIFWEQRGIYRVERGRTFALLSPDIIIQLERYGTAPVTSSGVSHPIFTQIGESNSGTIEYVNTDGDLVLAAFEWIPEWGFGIVAELPQDDIFAEVNSLAPFTGFMILGALALVAIIVPLATRQAIRPLGALTSLAENFAMGDLDVRIETTREDEIGRLTRTFNKMAEDLSELYRSLERRVEERTRQIRTASEVARDAVAIRDVETLLEETVNLITTRFGFYHAGVFLIDRNREYADLLAASSEGGKRMLARGHKLPVGKVGIVGYVTGTGKPRIVLDVGEDAIHFANPDLPQTRAEMALPLWAGDQIIGALDVQSQDPNAFGEEDVLVLQTMADQLAVAIENARLITELTDFSSRNRIVIDIYNQLSQRTRFDELLSHASEIIRNAFNFNRVAIGLVEGSEIVVRSASAAEGVEAAPLGVPVPLERGPLGRAVSTKAAVTIPANDKSQLAQQGRVTHSTVAVPLISLNQAIGALAVESTAAEGLDHRDIEILELIANQVAVALENARLFEETQNSLEQLDTLVRRQTAESWDELLEVIAQDKEARFAEFAGARYPEAVVDGGDSLQTPIAVRGQVVGRLNILAEKPGAWSTDDREVLEAVADEVAVALEQMRLLEELQRRAAQLQTAAEVARDASGLLDVETLLARTVRLIRERFDYHHVAVFLIDDSGEHAILTEATGPAGEEMKSKQHQTAVGSESIIGYVTEKGEAYVAHDVEQDNLYQAHPLLTETRTELGIPLKAGERVIGALDVQHSIAHTFSADDISVLQILSDQLAVAIENARLFEETLSRAQREQTVLELTSEVRAHEDLSGMLQTAVREMRQALGAKRSSIRLFEQDLPVQDESGEDTHSSSPAEAHDPPDKKV
jgi:GAF domain-containing protein/HAMP domain-containing protein